MKKVLLGAAALLWAVPALAQVQQSGTVTARHPAYWVTSGAIGDPGGATDSALSSLGVTNEGGPGLCVSSQRASAAGRQQLCLSTGTSTGATITLTNLGTAPSAPAQFCHRRHDLSVPRLAGQYHHRHHAGGQRHDNSISGLYQINGTQIAASNLSNGATGSGAVVLATSPAISGTWTGSPTFSGNLTFSGQAIHTGTSAPASASGQVYVMGGIAGQVLANTGQGAVYETTTNGLILEGDGTTNDVTLFNKGGNVVVGVPTGTTKLNFPSLISGTCSAGLGLDSGNNTILTSCPGAAGSIQVGTTTVTSGTNNYFLTVGTGTLAQVQPGQYPGLAGNTVAAAGNIGEVFSQNILVGSAVSLTTGFPSNIATISPTAGHWRLSGSICVEGGTSTSMTVLFAGFSTTTSVLPTTANSGGYMALRGVSVVISSGQQATCYPIGSEDVYLSGTTQYWMVAQPSFTVSTLGGYGIISAIRVQ